VTALLKYLNPNLFSQCQYFLSIFYSFILNLSLKMFPTEYLLCYTDFTENHHIIKKLLLILFATVYLRIIEVLLAYSASPYSNAPDCVIRLLYLSSLTLKQKTKKKIVACPVHMYTLLLLIAHKSNILCCLCYYVHTGDVESDDELSTAASLFYETV